MKTQEKSKLIEIGILYNLLNYGLEDTYLYFKNKQTLDSELLNDLLEKNINYINKAKDNSLMLTRFKKIEYEDINIITAIENSYGNIEYILSLPDKLLFNVFLDDLGNFYQITRLTFALHNICMSFNLEHIEKMWIDKILLMLLNGKTKTYIYKFILTMSISTVQNFDTWFIKFIRDYDYFTLIDGDYFIFISMFICHICNKKNLPDKRKDEFLQFLKSKSNGLNSDGSSWNRILYYTITKYNEEAALSMFQRIDDMFKLVSNRLFDIPLQRFGYTISDGNDSFTGDTAYDMWVQILIHTDNFYFSALDKDTFVNKVELPDTTKNYLQQKFIQEKIDISTDILVFFELPINKNVSLAKNKISYFTSVINSKNRCKILDEKSDDSNDFDVNQFIAEIVAGIKKIDHPIIKISSSLSKNDSLHSNYMIRIEKDKSTNRITNELASAVGKDIFDLLVFRLLNNYKNQKTVTGIEFSNEQMRDIINFKPNNRINGYQLLYNSSNLTDEDKQIVNNVRNYSISYVRDAIFWKNDAIKIDFNIDKDGCHEQKISNEDATKIIADQYPCINGLYAYEENGTRAFLTREELSVKIKDRYTNIILNYYHSGNITQNDVLYYKFIDKDIY